MAKQLKKYERIEKLREKLSKGEPSSGLWIQLASPMSAEIMADSGLDWVIVDSEHHPFNYETLLNILLAFRGSDTVPMVRAPWNDKVMIKQLLDMGFEGFLSPSTNSPEEARNAVAACRYPPVGIRGAGWTRPGRYGRWSDIQDFIKSANDLIICAVQIESVGGAEQIEEILKVEGLDWVMTGPADLSGTIRQDQLEDGEKHPFGNWNHPIVVNSVNKVIKAAKAAGVPAGSGVPIYDLAGMKAALERGDQLIAVGADVPFLRMSVDNNLKLFAEATQ